ncbi:MAG TPA: T9SS type A sorting domain-containing protein [Chitinophagaceae bacterium]|nr:T9SS type A sorting domain-containing protein [Chitinophagaceae bacterium]
MKQVIILLLFGMLTITAQAQWSNTTNLFADSLHTPVCNALKDQNVPIIVRSYPDSGYFVIWQDHRNDPTGYNDIAAIYAQKYDKTGKALWATNGVPASSSTNNQHYVFAQGRDYHAYSYAATDSAGGFYITYADDSSSSYTYQRVCVQHYKSDGSTVFGGAGAIIFSSVAGNAGVHPQLIADGNGGFFLSYIESINGYNSSSPDNLYVYCYKDVNGTLVNYGGGQVNENAVQVTNSSACGNYSTLNYPAAEVGDDAIFSDLQGGCNVVMYLGVNGVSGPILAYNKLFRAKQNTTATQYLRDKDFNPVAVTDNYTAGNVYRLYYLKTDHQEISCGNGSDVYVINQYRLVQNGFLEIDGGSALYDISNITGVTVPTAGNINASFLAVSERTYSQTDGVSRRIVKGYVVKEEIYDAIPYQRTSAESPDYPGYNQAEPAGTNKLNNFRDTLLWSPYNYDFSLSGGGNQIFLSEEQDSSGVVRLQHLAVEAQSADSFAIVYKTDVKQGTIIGQGYYGAPPLVTVNNKGDALFYAMEYSSGGGSALIHVSPVLNGAELAWGAMGAKTTENYDAYGSSSVLLDPVNGTGLIAWVDNRTEGTTGYDIYMRHLDSLDKPGYEPPYLSVKFAPDPYGPVNSSAALYGSSNNLTTFEISDGGVSPAVAISDNYNLGNVNVSVYDNTGSIRSYNGKPYLDRSYVITPDNNPNGAATVTIRLFFTTAEFDALKAADTSIHTPGDLAVIKQPSGSGSGSTYTIVDGEQTVIPQSWAAVDGGYYIEIQVTSFSNFFIFKNTNTLAVNWLGVQAQWQNATHAKVSWQVAMQQNVQSYTVQYSPDGISFTGASTVPAGAAETQYSSIVPANDEKNYYRVVETDIDGRENYSQVVTLQAGAQPALSIHPNPANNILYIEGLANYKSIQIADENGKIILQQNIISPMQSINVGHLAPGVYILTVRRNNELKTLKFNKM